MPADLILPWSLVRRGDDIFRAPVRTAPDGIVGPITWRALVSGMLSG